MTELLWIPLAATGCLLIFATIFCHSRFVFLLSLASATTSLILSTSFILSDRLTGDGITEATLFHLRYGLEGLSVLDFPLEALLTAGTVALCCCLARTLWRHFEIRNRAHPKHLLEFTILLSLTCFSVAVHPAVLQIVELTSEIGATTESALLNEELLGVRPLRPTSARPKSLVYIYTESLERTFFDPKIFPGLISSLRDLEARSLSFRGVRQAPMTEWTIAAMVASQCGVPLATFRQNRNDYRGITSFVPGATCIGDILEEAGYQKAFIGGADLAFAGKGAFYTTHKFESIYGLQDFQASRGSSIPTSRWGVYDDVLLDEATRKFGELAAADRPFALFVLTLDTHPPSGHPTPACHDVRYGDGNIPMLNAVKCTDKLVSNFVKALQKLPSSHDIIFVIASDHLQMRNDVSDMLERNAEQRENLFLLYGESVPPGIVKREATTLDIGPTVLSALGWDIENIALGRNLLNDKPTLTEKYGKDHFFQMLRTWRLKLWETWRPVDLTS